MTTDNTADLGAVTDNFLRCALRILVAPSLPMSDVDRLIGRLETADRPQLFRSQLAEYLWEHHMEELVVPGRDDLDLAIERIAAAFAMLDESDRCAPTPPLLWLDVSQPPTSNDRRFAMKQFRLGQMMVTSGAQQALKESGECPADFLRRHAHGDWGDLDAHGRQMNERAMAHERCPDRRMRVLSTYQTKLGVKLYVITEHDRSYTTVLLPEEY